MPARVPGQRRVLDRVVVARELRLYVRILSRRLRVNVMRLDGTNRRVFRSRWLPLAWSPNERQILVRLRKTPLIGLMSPHTGKVQELGSLPCGRVVPGAAWRDASP
jgi:hypothetical protein